MSGEKLVEKIDTLVVRAGQAGIALCEHLGKQGVPYVVLEKSRIAEAWGTSRWSQTDPFGMTVSRT